MTKTTPAAGRQLHIPSLAQELPHGWKWRRLDETCEGVFDCPHSTPVLTTDGPFVVRTQDIITGTFRADQAAHVSEETYQDRIRRAEPRDGDLLFSREGTYFGIAAEVPEATRVCLGQRMVLLRPKPKEMDSRFLKYWLNSPILASHVNGHRDGTVAERLNMPTIRALPLPVAPLKDQKRIGDILGTLDDKIALNRQMNDTLEAMARRLFKSWFVDFDPVHAKAAIRREHPDWPNDRISSTALPKYDPKIASLFPDEFEGSGMARIPKGWTTQALAVHVEIIKGRSYKSSELVESDTALVTLKSIKRGGGYRVDGLKPFNGTFKPDQLLNPGELVIAFTDVTQAAEVIGKPAIIWSDSRFATLVASLDLGIVRPKQTPLSVPFLYFLFLTEEFQNHAYSHCTGTTVLHLSREAVPTYPFVCPPIPLSNAFRDFAVSIFDQMNETNREVTSLAAVCDKLLPRLLSGDVSVSTLSKRV